MTHRSLEVLFSDEGWSQDKVRGWWQPEDNEILAGELESPRWKKLTLEEREEARLRAAIAFWLIWPEA